MSENSEFTNRRAPPVIRRVSILLSDPNCADIDINEDFILQRIDSFDKIHYVKSNKEKFLIHVEKKRQKDVDSVLTIIFIKSKDLNHPDVALSGKVRQYFI